MLCKPNIWFTGPLRVVAVLPAIASTGHVGQAAGNKFKATELLHPFKRHYYFFPRVSCGAWDQKTAPQTLQVATRRRQVSVGLFTGQASCCCFCGCSAAGKRQHRTVPAGSNSQKPVHQHQRAFNLPLCSLKQMHSQPSLHAGARGLHHIDAARSWQAPQHRCIQQLQQARQVHQFAAALARFQHTKSCQASKYAPAAA